MAIFSFFPPYSVFFCRFCFVRRCLVLRRWSSRLCRSISFFQVSPHDLSTSFIPLFMIPLIFKTLFFPYTQKSVGIVVGFYSTVAFSFLSIRVRRHPFYLRCSFLARTTFISLESRFRGRLEASTFSRFARRPVACTAVFFS